MFEDRMVALCRELAGRGKLGASALDDANANGAAASGWRSDDASGIMAPQNKSGTASLAREGSVSGVEDLMALKFSEIRRQTVAAGFDEAKIVEADDSPDPKSAMAALLLTAERAARHDSSADQEFATKLQLLKMSELRQKASSMGVDEAAVDEASDAEDPKQAVVALLVDAHNRSQS